MQLKVDTGVSLVALIGNDLHIASGVAKRIFDTLQSYNVRILVMAQAPIIFAC